METATGLLSHTRDIYMQSTDFYANKLRMFYEL